MNMQVTILGQKFTVPNIGSLLFERVIIIMVNNNKVEKIVEVRKWPKLEQSNQPITIPVATAFGLPLNDTPDRIKELLERFILDAKIIILNPDPE